MRTLLLTSSVLYMDTTKPRSKFSFARTAAKTYMVNTRDGEFIGFVRNTGSAWVGDYMRSGKAHRVNASNREDAAQALVAHRESNPLPTY